MTYQPTYLFRAAVLLLFVFFCGAISFSQTPQPTPQPSPRPALERKFLSNILRDQRAIWTSPFHLSRDDAKWLAPLGVSTIALIATDRRTARALYKNGDNLTRIRISKDISYAGALYTAGGISAAFYLAGRASGNARLRETGLLGVEALIDSNIVIEALKAVTERSRPRVDNASGEFFEGGKSFPSGHAINSWSLATIVANEYRHKPAVQVVAYGLASAVSISRFTARKHFLSDVLVGSAMGYGIGRYVYRTLHDTSLDRNAKTSSNRSKLFPFISPEYSRAARAYGLGLAWNF